MPDYYLAVEEGHRQIILLALQKLRLERPGWDWTLSEVEKQLGGQMHWPPYQEDGPTQGFSVEGRCLRCQFNFPASLLFTTLGGARYCQSCLPNVVICRGCGCTEEVACPGGCSWALPGVCSTCAASVGASEASEGAGTQ